MRSVTKPDLLNPQACTCTIRSQSRETEGIIPKKGDISSPAPEYWILQQNIVVCKICKELVKTKSRNSTGLTRRNELSGCATTILNLCHATTNTTTRNHIYSNSLDSDRYASTNNSWKGWQLLATLDPQLCSSFSYNKRGSVSSYLLSLSTDITQVTYVAFTFLKQTLCSC